MAWLDTAPRESDSNRWGEWVGRTAPPGPLEYIGAWMYEIGPIIPAVGGVRAIEWADVAAWSQVTGSHPTPREAKAIIDLSTTYMIQHHKALDPMCPPPWTDDTPEGKIANAKRMRNRRRRM